MAGINHFALGLVCTQMPKLDEQGATGSAERRMRRAGWVHQVTALRVIARFVAEHPVKNEDLFPKIMGVGFER